MADSLRALRRGLQRSSGRFALFFAVCDRAETRKELIRLLDESMPGTKLEEATLDAETVNPLAEILSQVGEGGDPVTVLGLERAVPMGSDDAPILRALNLERAEWPERLRRPVVFWIPEALLGALGLTAPDFLDWRSDTLHFPAEAGPAERDLAAFDSSLWQGGLDRRMPEQDRRARINELQSRLRTTASAEDPRVRQARASWVFELGSHHLFFGELDAAQEHYEKALSISKELGDRANQGASYHQLAMVAEDCDRYEEALEWYRKSLAISEELGNKSDMAASYHQLGLLAQEQGSYEEAVEWYRKALAILEELGNRAGMAASYHQLGNLSHLRDSYEEALEWYGKSLAIDEEMGDRAGMAGSYHQLGRVARARGSYEEALKWYRKSLKISQELGYRAGIALTTSEIGVVLTETAHAEEAVRWSLRAFAMRMEIPASGAGCDLHILRRQREILGDEWFRDLVEGHLDDPEMAAAVLKVTGDPPDEPAQEVAETPAEYGAGGRSGDEG